jgi:hypothetical protein
MRYLLVGGGCLAVLIGLQLLSMYLGGDDGPAWGLIPSLIISVIVALVFAGVLELVTDDDTYQRQPAPYQYPYGR